MLLGWLHVDQRVDVGDGTPVLGEPGPLDRTGSPDDDVGLVGAVLDDDPVLASLGVRARVHGVAVLADERRDRVGCVTGDRVEGVEGVQLASSQVLEKADEVVEG